MIITATIKINGGAEIARPENDGPLANRMVRLENAGPGN